MQAPFAPRAAAPLFYGLPYEARRLLLRVFRRDKYRSAQAMRLGDGEYSYRPFDEQRCIFVHVPKTGGVSISRALFGSLAGGHATIRHYQMVFARREFDSYFKFAFVRNPWDRLYSAYRFLRAGGMTTRDAEWAERNLSVFSSFDDFVRHWVTPANIYLYDHFVPQVEFLRLPGQSAHILDFVGRFENLEQDFSQVCAKLGQNARLTHENRTDDTSTAYRQAYSPEARYRVAVAYRDDIEALGYEF